MKDIRKLFLQHSIFFCKNEPCVDLCRLKRHNRNLISLGLKDEDFLVQEIMRLDITDDDMRRENAKQVLKRKAAKNNQQQQSATPK